MAAKQGGLSDEFVGDRLYEDLREFLRTARPDQKLASGRSLAQQYNMSHAAVTLVIDRLARQGLVYKVHGKGTFAAAQAAERLDEARTIVFSYSLPATSHIFYYRLWHGVAETAGKLGYLLQVRPLRVGGGPSYSASNGGLIEDAGRAEVAGMILPWLEPGVEDEMARVRPSLPVVITQVLHPGQSYVTVLPDTYDLGRQAGRYLVRRRVRRVAAVHRGEGFLAGLRSATAGADGPPEVVPVPFQRDTAHSALVEQVLAAEPDGLAFSEDYTAVRVLELIRRDSRDFDWNMAMVSHANTGESILPPEVVRIENDGYENGAAAVAMLRSLIEGQLTPQTEVRIKPHLAPPQSQVAEAVSASEERR